MLTRDDVIRVAVEKCLQPSGQALAAAVDVSTEIADSGSEAQRGFLLYWGDGGTGLRYARDLDLIPRFARPGGRFLDIGALPLVIMVAMARLGFDVEGVDIEPERFAAAVEHFGLRVAKCDIEREPLPFPDHSFDALNLGCIFEHLRIDLIGTVRELNRVLKPGGILTMSVPTSHGPFDELVRLGEGTIKGPGMYGFWSDLYTQGHAGHVHEYSDSELVAFFHELGFQAELIVRQMDKQVWYLPALDVSMSLVFRKVTDSPPLPVGKTEVAKIRTGWIDLLVVLAIAPVGLMLLPLMRRILRRRVTWWLGRPYVQKIRR
jgi:SAM-dependent methyltransferase